MRAKRIVRFVDNSFEAGFEKVEVIIRFSKEICNLSVSRRAFQMQETIVNS